ncbi:MAG TPA: hypothetical protein VE440_09385 [Gaiellaceae bacterium]|jgi:hypothetical protein|nr:hypothetical protein [Gaiellaceae bacterium]HZB36272.1 hypothetical protein [Gaiellaceae bacterium]
MTQESGYIRVSFQRLRVIGGHTMYIGGGVLTLILIILLLVWLF